MESIPELICYVSRLMFERRLTDMAGGNISARDGNKICITSRYSGARKHWQLTSQDILCEEMDAPNLLSDPRFSREGKMHLAVYKNYPDVQAIIHAHSFHVQPFVAACKPIKPVLESTQKFGTIELIKPAPAHSSELANNTVEGFSGKEEIMRKQAAAVLIPYHGIIVAGKDLLSCLDALERIDWNAWCIIAGRILG